MAGHWTAACPKAAGAYLSASSAFWLPKRPIGTTSGTSCLVAIAWIPRLASIVSSVALLLPFLVKMQLWHTLLQLGLLASTAVPTGAASWGFTDATVSVHTKGAGVGSGSKNE